MSEKKRNFNVRVYGILIRNSKVLVSDEFIREREITKLPGGGLEFGEGPINCVVREFEEELGIKISVLNHFYTTDFFVASAFDTSSQVISIYYEVEMNDEENISTSEQAFDFEEKKEGAQRFRWIPLMGLSEKDFTFVIDKKIALLLNEKYN